MTIVAIVFRTIELPVVTFFATEAPPVRQAVVRIVVVMNTISLIDRHGWSRSFRLGLRVRDGVGWWCRVSDGSRSVRTIGREYYSASSTPLSMTRRGNLRLGFRRGRGFVIGVPVVVRASPPARVLLIQLFEFLNQEPDLNTPLAR